jgi:hypothetical protein
MIAYIFIIIACIALLVAFGIMARGGRTIKDAE